MIRAVASEPRAPDLGSIPAQSKMVFLLSLSFGMRRQGKMDPDTINWVILCRHLDLVETRPRRASCILL